MLKCVLGRLSLTKNCFFFCKKAEFTMCAMIRNPTQSWTVGVNYTDLRLPWPFCSTPDL